MAVFITRIGGGIPRINNNPNLKGIKYYKGSTTKQFNYDTAVTNIGKCYFCKKSIPKKTPIFWFWAKFQKHGADKKITELNIKRKVCFRCAEEDVLNNLLTNHQEEIKKIQQLRKKFKRALKGKKCKRAIENVLVLEELQKEDFTKNFNSQLIK